MLNMCWQGGREDGRPDLADDSVNGVITTIPLSVQYKQEVTFSSCVPFFHFSPSPYLSSTSVTFTHLLLFVLGLNCTGSHMCGRMLSMSMNCREELWEKCLPYNDFSPMQMLYHILHVYYLCCVINVYAALCDTAVVSGHFLILGEEMRNILILFNCAFLTILLTVVLWWLKKCQICKHRVIFL